MRDEKSFARTESACVFSFSLFVLNPHDFIDQTFEFATADSIRVKLFTWVNAVMLIYFLTFNVYKYAFPLLRSTKWNANLILLRDYGELVALCKVIGWEIHIPNIPEGRKNGHPA